ncbi:MAG: hypothetical protein GY869_12560, partial [Planctomycetes bacterium]|nr:hypothetical protein [Planctomycetota bacterium]
MRKRNLILFLLGFISLILQPPSANSQIENYTFKLTQSNSSYEFWTTPPAERVFKDDQVPTDTDSEVKIFAAKNEFEPFQVIVKPTISGDVTVSVGDFGPGITTELYQVKYVNILEATDNLGQTGDYPDPLWPIENGDQVSLITAENTSFWFNVFVSETVSFGDYNTNVQIGGIDIPVRLHVFDFVVPNELHLKSQMNFSHNTILNKYNVPCCDAEYWMYVDMMKQFFIDHRLTSKSPLWPGGVTGGGGAPFIAYDCSTQTLTDPHGIWGFEHPANKYLNGIDFNDGIGYPSFMAATFLTNDPAVEQRGALECSNDLDIPASGWMENYPFTPGSFNEIWFTEYIPELQNYLTTTGYLDKGYYYIANEPQDQADYDAVAWFSQELKRGAPNLELMVSEEPRPEIYNHSTYTGVKIDIWLPVLNNYDPVESHDREENHNEESWIYFLHGTRPPYFNPITLDHPGIESKFTGWFLWKYRVRGIAYYSLNNWNPNPWTDPMTSGHNG